SVFSPQSAARIPPSQDSHGLIPYSMHLPRASLVHDPGANFSRLPSSARCPKFVVVAEPRKRLVISRWLEQRHEAPHYGIDRPGCVPNVNVDRIELVP